MRYSRLRCVHICKVGGIVVAWLWNENLRLVFISCLAWALLITIDRPAKLRWVHRCHLVRLIKARLWDQELIFLQLDLAVDELDVLVKDTF